VRRRDDPNTAAKTWKLELPEYVPPTEEELARWKALAEEADRIRAEIGPIDIRTYDLLHLARAESEDRAGQPLNRMRTEE